jgi:hypothetical protein
MANIRLTGRLSFIVQLKRPMRERVILAVLMALGLVASGAGIAKTVIYERFTKEIDYFYIIPTFGAWM